MKKLEWTVTIKMFDNWNWNYSNLFFFRLWHLCMYVIVFEDDKYTYVYFIRRWYMYLADTIFDEKLKNTCTCS